MEKIKSTLYWVSERTGFGFLKNFVPAKIYCSLLYERSMGKKINWDNPTAYNEKLQWLKIHDRDPKYVKMVDKYEVRKHVSDIIGDQYLIPLIGVWKKFEEIDFDKLPNQFVLKCTHDSGGVVICKDKTSFDFKKAQNIINSSLKSNYYYCGREWAYKFVEPRVICEQYMVDKNANEINDYKIMCFNGEPKLIQLHQNRNTNHTLDFYDVNWNLTEISQGVKNSKVISEKPKKLDEMLSLARKLSTGLIFSRIDFYEIDEKIYFGEITFCPTSGFEKIEPVKYDEILGSWIELPQIK